MRLLLTQNSKLKTQHFFLFILGFLLVFFLFSSPCFAGQMGLPSLPNLPSGERIYDAGGASPDQPEQLDSVSRPIDAQGELKTDTDGVKANKYKIRYNGNTKRIQSRIQNDRKTGQEDLEANEPPGQIIRLPDARGLGFQYQPPLLGRIGLDTSGGKANKQAED
jgi:hypothetical protein